MKKVTIVWSVLIILLAFSFLSAQTVNVTFRANASTVPDTMGPNSAYQVRGDTPPLTWGGDTGGNLSLVGGDYWQVTLQFPQNTSIQYKLFANATGNTSGNGWESGSNISFNTGTQDTILPVHYFRRDGTSDPFAPPYTATQFMDVYFRVNMQAYFPFDPTTQTMMVKGGVWPHSWGDLTWHGDSTLGALTAESETVVGQFTYPVENFYSGRLRIPQDSLMANSVNTIEYKFVIVDKVNLTPVIEWESIPNRQLPVPQGYADTTVYWSWWNDIPYTGPTGEDSVMVKFRADLTRAINANSFAIGDTLIVRWGYNGTAIFEEDTLINEFLTNFYSKDVQVNSVEIPSTLQYQYYLVKHGTDFREIFYDFGDPIVSSQEKRKMEITNTFPTLNVVQDTILNNITALHRAPIFQNTDPLPPGTNILVTYTCDLRPPYWQVLLGGDTIVNIQGDSTTWIYPGDEDSIMVWGVYHNGPGNGTAGWQGWNNVDLASYRMYDDGPTGGHGDEVQGDSIFSRQVFFSADSNDIIGQEYKYGINGWDNEAGSGGFGLNHFSNLDPTVSTMFIRDDFGSINPPFYWVWDFNNHTLSGIEGEGDVTVIKTPNLYHNFPNPFNPVTTIRFKLPRTMEVKLIIYDVLGRKIRTLLDGKQQPGAHIIRWSGTNDRGQLVGSGIYFYRLIAEDYEKTMRMLLVK